MIKELTINNFSDFIRVLDFRGEAPEDFYRWKYLDQPFINKPTGYVAYIDGEPVGCIGIINKTFINSDGSKEYATWFADWFVLNQIRGLGIGLLLLKRVYALSEFAFGIPGPSAAQNIAKKAGYNVRTNYSYVTIPCSSFTYGYNKYKDFKALRVLRGMRALILAPRSRADEQYFTRELSLDHVIDFIKCDRNSFLIDLNEIEWLLRMPCDSTKNRQWLMIENMYEKHIIILENDHNSNRRARLFFSKLADRNNVLISVLSFKHVLVNFGVNYIEYFTKHQFQNEIHSSFIENVPLHSAQHNYLEIKFEMGSIESKWRDFKMW